MSPDYITAVKAVCIAAHSPVLDVIELGERVAATYASQQLDANFATMTLYIRDGATTGRHPIGKPWVLPTLAHS